MNTIKQPDAAATKRVQVTHIGARPQTSGISIRTRVGGGTPEEVAEATERFRALAKRVTVGKLHGASEVIREERE